MQYPIIDLITSAYINNGWTGLDISTGKNLLPFPYDSTTGVYNGVDFIINDDGTVSVSGTSTATIFFDLRNRFNPFTLSPGTYIINGAISGAYIIIGNVDTNTAIGTSYSNNGIFTITEDTNAFAFIQVASGSSPNGIVKPMIRLSSVTDDTYEPYNPNPNNDFPNRLKLPLPHYFPHPGIDSLKRASDGTMTADDVKVLKHYLTPLGIGNIELGRFHAINPIMEENNNTLEFDEEIPMYDFQIEEKKTRGEE